MRKLASRWLEEIWYRDHFVGTWLMPFSMLFMDAVKFRRWLYKKNYKPTTKLAVPVIIVGNITVGGTGKTPLVIYLVKQLQAAGFKPAVISRGYGRKDDAPEIVTAKSEAGLVGDEPLLIAQQTNVPVVVGANRVAAGQLLLDSENCDVIIADDGLQHYALQRDIEIVVIDGERRFGNNFCLPSGPLREPQERIREADFIICNDGDDLEDDEILMTLQGAEAINLFTEERKPLDDFKTLNCTAFAGIGNPQRFFNHLQGFGIECEGKKFPDHYDYNLKDISFNGAEAILMTEKDAVKCKSFATEQHWYVPVVATFETDFSQRLITLLRTKYE